MTATGIQHIFNLILNYDALIELDPSISMVSARQMKNYNLIINKDDKLKKQKTYVTKL